MVSICDDNVSMAQGTHFVKNAYPLRYVTYPFDRGTSR